MQLTEEEVALLVIIRHETFLLFGPLNGLLLTQHEYILHPDVWIFHDDVGLSMVLEMAVVPPVSGRALRGKQ